MAHGARDRVRKFNDHVSLPCRGPNRSDGTIDEENNTTRRNGNPDQVIHLAHLAFDRSTASANRTPAGRCTIPRGVTPKSRP